MMTIGQFAQTTGLSAKALRLYDEMGLLTPADVDACTGYRRYHPHQVRHGAQLAVMRRMGVPLEVAGQVLSDPDRADDLLETHAVQLLARHQAERAALVAGRALLQSYDRPAVLQRRQAQAQPWVGAVLDVPADPGAAGVNDEDVAELDNEAASAMFTALHSALAQAGSAVSGPWWTTLRAGPDPARVQVVLCWPVAGLPGEDFVLPGVQLEMGVLPERTEALVQVLHQQDDSGAESDVDADDVMAGLPVAAAVHLQEQLAESDEVLDAQVRQVGVLGADGVPVGVELVVTTQVHARGDGTGSSSDGAAER